MVPARQVEWNYGVIARYPRMESTKEIINARIGFGVFLFLFAGWISYLIWVSLQVQ